MITRQRLLELLIYEPDTGIFRWRESRGGSRKGDEAGSISNGYVRITLDRRRYRAHRLVFLYVLGTIPAEVDHRNRNRADNRWGNLRAATDSQNNVNTTLPRLNNSSGIRGVKFIKKTEKWVAHIQFKGNCIHLGTFSTIEKAATARCKAEKLVFGEFAPAA